MGKIIELNAIGEFEVTGVLKDLPKNSHMVFEALVPYQALIHLQRSQNSDAQTDWKNFRNSYAYLMLSETSSTKSIERFLNEISNTVYAKDKQFYASFRLQSLKEIVPGKDLHDQIGPSWEYASLGIFAFLTLMILLPACFNYANISISRALKRMKEIGLRKVMG